MKFTLTYEGPLGASGNHPANSHKAGPKLASKWKIRDQFKPQLTDIISSHPIISPKGYPTYTEAKRAIMEPIKRGPFVFVALVRPKMDLVCGLDIKILVNHEPGSVITKTGDLDNRLKTLLDALRVPASEQECVGQAGWSGTYPCLLQDDALVTDIKLETEQWFSGAAKAENEVKVSIDVRVRTSKLSTYTKFFGID